MKKLILVALLIFALPAQAAPRVFTPEENQQIYAARTAPTNVQVKAAQGPAQPPGPYCLYASMPGHWLRQKLICGFHSKAECDKEADKQNARTHDRGYCQ